MPRTDHPRHIWKAARFVNDVRLERTEWRDQELSARHRQWGFNCPAVDVDFLMIEYNHAKPVALIDYKHFKAIALRRHERSMVAITELANRASLPFLVAYYWPDIWAFRVYTMNDRAQKYFTDAELLSERDYVERLYALRSMVLVEVLEEGVLLNTALPGR